MTECFYCWFHDLKISMDFICVNSYNDNIHCGAKNQ